MRVRACACVRVCVCVCLFRGLPHKLSTEHLSLSVPFAFLTQTPPTRAWEVARTVVAPPSSGVKCLWEVFVFGFGLLFLSCVCVCVGVGGVVLCRCVCV